MGYCISGADAGQGGDRGFLAEVACCPGVADPAFPVCQLSAELPAVPGRSILLSLLHPDSAIRIFGPPSGGGQSHFSLGEKLRHAHS
jgi:hypothetical protein